MIYYFSGTGNSLFVAQHLAGLLGETVQPMTEADTPEGESVGLVFPVYGWGIPNVVGEFVRRWRSCGAYVYAVMTCGDDMGYADRVLDRVLTASVGRRLDAAFSVLMPDVYVCLPGFDIDSDEECRGKFAEEREWVPQIAGLIRERRAVRRLRRGPLPWCKTYVLRPLFNRFLLTDKYFKASPSLCNACAVCEKKCPVRNIRLEDGSPRWQSHCAGCMACFHACPRHAINFGKMTQKKGQYNLKKHLNE